MRYKFHKSKYEFEIPNPLDVQLESFKYLLDEGLDKVLYDVGIVTDNTGRDWELYFNNPRVEKPTRDPVTALKLGVTYDAPWYITANIKKAGTEQIKKKEIYMGDLPIMTEEGIFIINGVKKVVISQLSRSQGVYFEMVQDKISQQAYPTAKILPQVGVWLDFEISKQGIIYVRIDRKRKIPVTNLLRVFGLQTDEEILSAFDGLFEEGEENLIAKTLGKDSSKTFEDSAIEIFVRQRAGDVVTPEVAKTLVEDMFFNVRRYSLGSVGRFKLNMKFGSEVPIKEEYFTLQREDIINTIKYLVRLGRKEKNFEEDSVDSLENRRLRAVGELLQDEIRYGFFQLERLARERMALQPREKLPDPSVLITPRPVAARIISYLASGQLAQLLGEYNVLDALDHKRRISVLGKGGITKERATYSIRDSHPTHYGRIGAVRTPEGMSVGLVNYLAVYARLNEYGFIESPYFKVEKKNGKVYVSDEVVYLAPYQENIVNIGGGAYQIDDNGQILQDRIPTRRNGYFYIGNTFDLDYVEVAPRQILGISACLVPFIGNDDVARALIATQQSAQAVPLVKPQTPLVGTGIESFLAKCSNVVVTTDIDGVIDYVDADKVTVKGKSETREYKVQKFGQSSKDSCFNQYIVVKPGEKVKKGDVLAEGPSAHEGELALGTNLVTAFMVYEGLNYEDAFVISSRVVEEDLLSSITISDYTLSVLETKLGLEEITSDIPNVAEESLRHLDAEGIAVIGSKVQAGDILVGKVTPKGHVELTAEQRLLRAVFGESMRDVADNSLRMPNGREGVVIDVTVITPKEKEKMPKGVIKEVVVKVAEFRRITIGDKLSNRHGQKGVIAKIVPKEDMPHLEDGTIVDVVIAPGSILGRMNIGIILEAHLGWAAANNKKKYAIEPFVSIEKELIAQELKEAGLPENGKTKLINGKTGEYYDQEVTIGNAYYFKLHHMAEDKMHARSMGPYSLITQQPLGGKAQNGGQRFGEMEVWALEAYGAAANLHELLTIKSDDVVGRLKAYQSITSGRDIPEPNLPESFKLLIRQLNGLGLKISPMRDGEIIDTQTRDRFSQIASQI